ncbi:MAG: aldolase/citrate lyase family protein [Gammaproteobacteria bacterium]|nr:aldolase/citrate lyase family protein [Gammaproteobacteria bacterium]MDH3507829.1 aldolase/citrate lyase family protein [Gammaproteobacteria bacterium]
MKYQSIATVASAALITVLLGQAQLAASQEIPIFNTVKQKLGAGERVVGVTVATPDPDIYCAVANAGFDFVWIEMQHSPLTFAEAARMIWACRDAPAVPFIRVPGPTEGDIQKAADIGALGIIVPMVDSVAEIRDAVQFAHYPPLGTRSQGGGQYRGLYGDGYRAAANENIMVVAMIESPTGVEVAEAVANVEGVDVVFVASSDLGSFTGLPQGHPEYEAHVTRVKNATLGAGRGLGGPLAWMTTRPEYNFFQAPSTTSLVSSGARGVLEAADPCYGVASGVSPVEGEDPCP